MIARSLIVAALIVETMLLALLVPDARAAVEITEANADQRLSQAETAFRAGRRDEAERLLWEVTGWANHLSGPVGFGDDPASTAMAERMYQRVLATVGRTFGADDDHAWDALLGLSNLYRKQRRFEEAESLLRRAISITQKSTGPVGLRFFAEGTAVSALATVFEEQGRSAEAEATYRRAADFFDVATPAPAKEKRDEALLHCALMLRSAGRWAAAAELEARMLPEHRGKISEMEAEKVPTPGEQLLDSATLNAGRNPDDPRIRALVAYLATQGFTLIHKHGGYWLVSAPDTPGWEKSVSIRSFPAAATEAQMQGALQRINLAYRLNARAHLAMSCFDEPKESDDARNRTARKLAQLFVQ